MNITLDNEVNFEIVVMTAYKVGIVFLFLKNNRCYSDRVMNLDHNNHRYINQVYDQINLGAHFLSENYCLKSRDLVL